MLYRFCQTCLQEGSFTFDVVLTRMLSVATMVALDCRPGDYLLAYKKLSGDQHMKFEDVYLTLSAEGAPSFEELRCRVVTRFEKGKKFNDDNRERRLLPHLDSAYNSICFISLLVGHCLRHNLFKHGTELSHVLAQAFRRKDKRIEWAYPKCPLISTTSVSALRVVIDQPASNQFLVRAVKQMGLWAGFLERTIPFHICRGGAADLMRINSDQLPHMTTTAALTTGHNRATLNKSIIDRYAGPADVAVNVLKDKVKEGKVDRRLQQSEEGYVEKPVTFIETNDWLVEHAEHWGATKDTILDIATKAIRGTARSHIRQHRREEWMKQQRNATIDPPKRRRKSEADKPTVTEPATTKSVVKRKSDPLPNVPKANKKSKTSSPILDIPIDPELLEQDARDRASNEDNQLDNDDVDKDNLASLVTMFTEDNQDDEEEVDPTLAIHADEDFSEELLHEFTQSQAEENVRELKKDYHGIDVHRLTPTEFVTFISTFNMRKHDVFARTPNRSLEALA